MTMDVSVLKNELDGDHFKDFFPLYVTTFGDSKNVGGSEFDLASVAKANRERNLPDCQFILACGSKEFIRERVENDVSILRKMDFNVQYICAEGYDHNFKMWNDYIEFGLDRLLPLKRKAIYPAGEI